jgi:ribosomal protein S18 acetylase RimI-like enzyme
MEIKTARETDIIEILFFIRECVKDFNSKGIFHWSSQFPTYQFLLEASQRNDLLMMHENSICVGIIIIDSKQDDVIPDIEWEDKSNSFMISHLAVHPKFISKSVGSTLLDHINRIALEKEMTSIHTYAFVLDNDVHKALTDANFREVAEFTHKQQLLPYKAFEKVF